MRLGWPLTERLRYLNDIDAVAAGDGQPSVGRADDKWRARPEKQQRNVPFVNDHIGRFPNYRHDSSPADADQIAPIVGLDNVRHLWHIHVSRE